MWKRIMVRSPVPSRNIRKAEKRFIQFFFGYWTFWLILFTTSYFFVDSFDSKITGNIFWCIGSLLVLFSVMHSRYFDIKKRSNPDNRMFSVNFNSDVLPIFKKFEKITNNAWLLGFVFLALSRFYQY